MKRLFFTFLFFPAFSFASFVDVDTTHPHFHPIDFLSEKEVVSGYEEEGEMYFRPRQKVNRAEALKMLLLAADIPVNPRSDVSFPDIRKNDWFADYVHTAAAHKIVKGFTDGNFHPGKQVSRAEFLKMLVMSFDVPFTEDSESEDWFVPFFDTAEEFRILDEPELSPYESLSRGDIAEYIYRAHILSTNRFESKYTYSGMGSASFYDQGFAGRPTANGEIYDPMDMTAAHRILPFGTKLKVWNWNPAWSNDDKDYVIVRVNDRGPYHSDRILDLSRKAFERLAPSSRGVIDVVFEVYSDNLDEQPTIPEQIRPSLTEEAKEKSVPDVLADKFLSKRTRSGEPTEDIKKALVKKRAKKPIPRKKKELIPNRPTRGTIAYISENFFPNLTLRRGVPSEVIVGRVIEVEGTVKNPGAKKVIVFLQNLETKAQEQFKGAVSGANFSVPIIFFEPGNFHLGIVFDDDRRSRVGKIKVSALTRDRKFRSAETHYVSHLDVNVIPEESRVVFSWAAGEDRLTKIVFSQNHKSALLFEYGLNHISVPYKFFDQFRPDRKLAIDVFQADSSDGNLESQITNWQQVSYKNFILTPGFPDKEEDTISVHQFPRFLKDLDMVHLNGKVLEGGINLPDHVFLISTEGTVEQIPIKKNGDKFFFSLKPHKYGTYVLEIVSDQGEILFNRGMYFHKNIVLPVAKWEQTFIRSESTAGIRNWINQLRKKYRKSPLAKDSKLDKFAQHYAQRMANEGFISHTTPEGLSFKDRIKMAEMFGEFGENLGYGTTLELALNGLENSASHRQNLLSAKWNRVGIGLAQNKKKEFYVVQVFGRAREIPEKEVAPLSTAEKVQYQEDQIKSVNTIFIRAYEIIQEAKLADTELSKYFFRILATADDRMEIEERRGGGELSIRKKIWLLLQEVENLENKCGQILQCSSDRNLKLFLADLKTKLKVLWDNWSEVSPNADFQKAEDLFSELEEYEYFGRKNQRYLSDEDRKKLAVAMGMGISFDKFLMGKEIVEAHCPEVRADFRKSYIEEVGAWCGEESQRSVELLRDQFMRNHNVPTRQCFDYIEMAGDHCAELNTEYQKFRGAFLAN